MIKRCRKRDEVQIAPYWNWNPPRRFTCSWGEICSNCTLLELKLLKLCTKELGRQVQIAPYWNWNCRCRWCRSSPSRSNCTLLELKLLTHWLSLMNHWKFKLHLTGIETIILPPKGPLCSSVQIAPYWNWNSCRRPDTRARHCCSNCTLLELKLLFPFSFPFFLSSFKLHLTGIETWLASALQAARWRSNCTLLELKLA